MRIRLTIAASIATAGLAALALAAPGTRPAVPRGTSRPIMDPTAPGLEVREWAVFVLDATEGQVNADGTVAGAMPAFVTDRRYVPGAKAGAAAAARPAVVPHGLAFGLAGPVAQPVAVIRFVGTNDGKVDVSVKSPRGSFVGFWPRATERTNELLWRDVTVEAQPAEPPPVAPADGWFAKLRAADPKAAYAAVSAGGDHVVAEPFLAYDVKFPMASPFTVKESAGFTVDLTNKRDEGVRDLVLFQGDGDGVRSAVVGDLAGPPPTTKPAAGGTTSKPAAAGTSSKPATRATTKAATRAATAPATAPATAAATAAATMPTTVAAATTRPANVAHAVLRMGSTSRPTVAGLLAPWRAAMSAAGVSDGDAELIAATVSRYAADGHRLTAVYRVDPADLDKLLPIEVVPQPARIRRFALVIVRNADPSAKTEVDELIAQLGSDDWATREAASRALLALGPSAVKKLQAAKGNADLEVTTRAERLLQVLAPAQQSN